MMWFFIASAKAIFAGWMVGCLCLPRLLLVFNQAQLLVGSICGLLLVAISTITVPHLTNGSLWMFTLVRFVYGIFMNMVLLETIYIQEAMPEGFGIPALVSINVVFCCVDIVQAYLCGGPMFYWDGDFKQACCIQYLWYFLCILDSPTGGTFFVPFRSPARDFSLQRLPAMLRRSFTQLYQQRSRRGNV